MEKMKYKYLCTYVAVCFSLYINGSFVNASFNIAQWDRDSRSLYGIGMFVASLVLGVATLIAVDEIKTEAKKLHDEDSKSKINKH